jgi:hypothetical protein
MEFSSNSKWAAYFGGATVVASLLLVAGEIRQNTLALSAQALQDLNVTANDVLRAAEENDQLSGVLVKGARNQVLAGRRLTGLAALPGCAAHLAGFWGSRTSKPCVQADCGDMLRCLLMCRRPAAA